ncbi:phosphatidyl-myo-inositol alpha-mannosyltransferase [Luteimicrobium xylanilyticum]|uniref:Phosphatidyl-myo-inositol alpha-mannosyltransferase n=1 Tax=Luteimicrobium xylanilyticum TaxID=1133546 RepID=A0A5P9QCG9_9MICO|nr:glycosyltransferase family 4 protein [Luteimicrobium xylanilyticum]QFU98989.1 Phosphatidyl-myo-inositol alpha-mannosyltransferase [Luteimicrobium xylanilyticum]
MSTTPRTRAHDDVPTRGAGDDPDAGRTDGEGAPPLTVGLLIDDSLDRPDGVQQYVLTLGAWLAARGHTVHYLTASSERTDLENLHVVGKTVNVRFNGNRLGTPRPVPRSEARELVERLDLDVLHVQMPYSPFLAGRVIDAATRGDGRTAVVGTFHIYPQSRLVSAGTRLLGALERKRLARFDAVLAVSEAAQEFARDAFGLDPRVVGNPVDTARFVPAPDAPLVPHRPDGAVPHVAFLGRLVDRKGPRELVDALVRLRADVPGLAWRATIAGRGPLLDDLRTAAGRGGIADRVSFPGFLAEDDKAAFLQDADVVALPSTGGESFGISVVEALAASRGVVLAGDNPGYRTVMRGLEDQLVDPRDTAVFAGTLATWLADLDDDVTREETVVRQRAAAARFDVDVVGAQVEETYRAAVDAAAR